MRSERLLRIVVLLQSRGRLTARELADELEVSMRTIQRDMEALSGAGVPVYALRGGAGGWELLPDYRASLTGLSTAEALAIVIGRPRSILADLGLDDAGDEAMSKLLAAVPADARARAEHARQRLLVDPSPWGWASVPEPVLPQLQEAAWDDRIVRMRYAASHDRFDVAPLGLVVKGSQWYFVGMRDDLLRTYRVARVHDLTVTGRRFERPADFDLAEYWHRSTTEYAESLPICVVKLRVRGDALTRMQWTYAKRKQVGEPDADGWADAELDLEDEFNALGAIRLLGNEVVVVSPASLRRAAVRDARAFADANA